MPGDLDGDQSVEPADDGNTALRSRASAFHASCQMWLIFHEVAWRYYGNENESIPDEALLEFAEHTFHRLLRWADSLPLLLVQREESTHGHAMMQ
jgi:hypothetical protein